jgi:hypothetical protein
LPGTPKSNLKRGKSSRALRNPVRSAESLVGVKRPAISAHDQLYKRPFPLL